MIEIFDNDNPESGKKCFGETRNEKYCWYSAITYADISMRETLIINNKRTVDEINDQNWCTDALVGHSSRNSLKALKAQLTWTIEVH